VDESTIETHLNDVLKPVNDINNALRHRHNDQAERAERLLGVGSTTNAAVIERLLQRVGDLLDLIEAVSPRGTSDK
jgi:hypothetical protein